MFENKRFKAIFSAEALLPWVAVVFGAAASVFILLRASILKRALMKSTKAPKSSADSSITVLWDMG